MVKVSTKVSTNCTATGFNSILPATVRVLSGQLHSWLSYHPTVSCVSVLASAVQPLSSSFQSPQTVITTTLVFILYTHEKIILNNKNQDTKCIFSTAKFQFTNMSDFLSLLVR